MRERWMMNMPVGRWIAALLLVAAATPAVHAQDGLLLNGQFLGASRNFGAPLGPGPAFLTQAQVFNGGRYALIAGSVFDGRTGAAVYDVHDAVAALDDARPRVFVWRGDSIWAVNVPSGTAGRIWAGERPLVLCAHAASADVLFCQSLATNGMADVVAIDVASASARVIATIPVTSSVGPWRVTPDGARLYFLAREAGPLPGINWYRLAALDTTTARLVTTALRATGVFETRLFLDDLTERVYFDDDGFVHALTKDLEPLGGVSLGVCVQMAASPHTGRLYVYGVGRSSYYGYQPDGPGTLRAFDAVTYAPLTPSVIVVPPGPSTCAPMTLFSAPGPPRGLTADVAGHDVTLSWTNVGAASGFVIEVGFAPGRSDLHVFLGAEPRVTFASVPPGVYFVRVRGGNEVGAGRPSDEIAVVVR